jgi:hypothetical protein
MEIRGMLRWPQRIGGFTAARLDVDRYVNRINMNGAQTELVPLIASMLDQHVAEYRLCTVHEEH